MGSAEGAEDCHVLGLGESRFVAEPTGEEGPTFVLQGSHQPVEIIGANHRNRLDVS